MIVPVFALKLPASDWYLFLFVSAMFLVSIWLLIDELLKWSKKREERYGTPPSHILKRLDSIVGHYSERPPVQPIPSEEENRSSAVAEEKPEKAA
jgi:hypothetical protein